MEKILESIGNIKLQPYGTDFIGKHNGWAYQFLNNNYEGIHLGVCCKDFLQDIVYSELTKNSITIYGQTSNYTGTFDKQDSLILCLYPHTYDLTVISQDKLIELCLNLQGFLNEIESLRNYSLSTVEFTDNKFLIYFSKEWIESPLIFSAFTLFCRIGFYYNGNLEKYFSTLFDNTNNILLDPCDKFNILNYYNTLLIFIYDCCIINKITWDDLKTPGQVHSSGFFSNIRLIKYTHDKNN